jgi:hypothetical protein
MDPESSFAWRSLVNHAHISLRKKNRNETYLKNTSIMYHKDEYMKQRIVTIEKAYRCLRFMRLENVDGIGPVR